MEALGIKIDSNMKTKLSQVAKKTDRSVSAVARIAIEKGLVFFEKGGSHQKNLDKVAATK
jgi:predicted transcriptional regulator